MCNLNIKLYIYFIDQAIFLLMRKDARVQTMSTIPKRKTPLIILGDLINPYWLRGCRINC